MLNCVELARDIVSIPSFNGNEEVAAYLKRCLEKNNLTVEEFRKEDTVNLVSRIGKGKKTLLFNAHTDTVPPAFGATDIKGILKDNKLSGLGTVDMKSAAAAMTAAFLELSKIQGELNGQVILALVGDEERGGTRGTKVTVDAGVSADYVVIGEPTNLNICRSQKSALHIELTASGVAHHATRIKPGENAITKVTNAISSLQEAFPIPNVSVHEFEL